MKNILKKLQEGQIKFHEIEKYASAKEAAKIRLLFIEKLTKNNYSELKNYNLDPRSLQNKNIENFIGSTELPLGIAGPIKVKGENSNGEYFLPLTTTEGALVASVSRGCKLINLSGGTNTDLEYIGTTRAPLFSVKDLKTAREFINWVNKDIAKLKDLVEKVDPFVKLIKIKPFSSGRNVWLRIYYNTYDAMGMNMATQASQKIAEYAEQNFKAVKLVAVSGNLCVDKKASSMNAILGRGRKVQAECFIKNDLIKKYLHTTPEKLVEVNHKKTWQGAVLSGSIAANAHIANIIAAIFIATGQDAAQVVESSSGNTIFEQDKSGIYVCVTLPSLMIGTVGGGTGLPKQREAIKLMLKNIGSSKEKGKVNQTHKLAEIIASACLAGEISLHGALASGHLASSHMKLGKGFK
jgi:hydroxymethylglutaryl-CoA reductase (NADPH)